MEKNEKNFKEEANQMTKNFGEHLKALLKSRGWYLKHLADASGIAQSEISRIINNRKTVEFPTMFRLIWAFDLEVSDFLDQEWYEKPIK